uniref:Trypsin 1a n=1 Tax=Diatraea saccharalis TaxID=40085 RepID=T1QDH4_9NEOP|nr:trypsin 1a [Diatraea saccharalis]
MWAFISIFTFVYCLFQAVCSAAPQLESVVSNNTRIVGGTPTTIERYPYAVQVNMNNRLVCGGTLISRTCVLSAAHCFVDRYNPTPNPSHYSARVGATRRDSGGSTYRTRAIIVHERHNFITQDSDIAVMALRNSVRLSNTVALAQLPRQGLVVPDNATLIHIGWGALWVNGPLAQELNHVTIQKVNHIACARQYAMIQLTVTTNMICAGLPSGGADACQGDSGGPLIASNGLVVGVTSWGNGCGHPLFPGVSARVSNFSNWIDLQVARYNASPTLSSVNVLVLMASLLASVAVLK